MNTRIVYPDDTRTAKDLGEYIRVYASHDILAFNESKPKRSLKLVKLRSP